MISKFLKRKKEDNANGAFVLGLMLIMALMLVGAIMFDLSKAYQLKSSYINTARKAAQAAIMKQSTEGYLTYEAAGEAVKTYEMIRDTVINRGNSFSECVDEDSIIYKVSYVEVRDDKTERVVSGEVSRSAIDEISRNVNRDISKVAPKEISALMGIQPNDSRVHNGRFRELRIELEEGTENIMLPGAFKINQSGDEAANRMKCQKLSIASKAEIFLGDTDGEYK